MTQTAAATEWEPQIADEITELGGVASGTTHIIVHVRENEPPILLDFASSVAAASAIANDQAERVDGGDVVVAPLAQIQPYLDGTAPAAVEPGGDPIVEEEPEPDPHPETAPPTVETTPVAGTTRGEDADTGKLFDVKVIVDPAQPTALHLALSGGIALDMSEQDSIELYNKLKAGKPFRLNVEGHVAGATKRHRRDKEGDVDAVVETKSLIVDSVNLEDAA